MSQIYACHFNDPTNLGDQVCCPVDYFEPLRTACKLDWHSAPDEFTAAPLIVGGGGLLNPVLGENLAALLLRRKAPVVVWGWARMSTTRRGLITPNF
jgi:hypothetical protein